MKSGIPAAWWKAIPNNVFLPAAETFPLSPQCSGTKAKEKRKLWTDVKNRHSNLCNNPRLQHNTQWARLLTRGPVTAQSLQCCSNTLFRPPKRAVPCDIHIYPLKLQREVNKKGRRASVEAHHPNPTQENWKGEWKAPGDNWRVWIKKGIPWTSGGHWVVRVCRGTERSEGGDNENHLLSPKARYNEALLIELLELGHIRKGSGVSTGCHSQAQVCHGPTWGQSYRQAHDGAHVQCAVSHRSSRPRCLSQHSWYSGLIWAKIKLQA